MPGPHPDLMPTPSQHPRGLDSVPPAKEENNWCDKEALGSKAYSCCSNAQEAQRWLRDIRVEQRPWSCDGHAYVSNSDASNYAVLLSYGGMKC